MTALVLRDARLAPQAFRWNGPLPVRDIEEWRARKPFNIPDELLEVWQITGGGELFESETIFEPSPGHDDDIDEANEQLLVLGLPVDHLAFHRGRCVTVIERGTDQIVELELGSFRELARHESFDDWYRGALRSEYAGRYGLNRSS